MEEQPQAKRRRRPSVRLGEIGFAAPYDASSMWLEAPRQRRKQARAGKEGGSGAKGRSGPKPPRIVPLEQVAGDQSVVREEEWSVIEPAVASGDEEKFLTAVQKLVNSTPAKEQQVKRWSGITRKVSSKARGKGVGGARMGWGSSGKEATTRAEAPVDADSPENRGEEEEEDEDEEEEEEEKEILRSKALEAYDEAPDSAETFSDSEELLGGGLKGDDDLPADDSENTASDGSEEGDAGANPNSHGDEMQGAIEDGPGQVNGKGFGKVKQRQGQRRSGRQVASREMAIRDIASRDTASRDTASRDIAIRAIAGRDVASRDTASRDTAGEPSGRFQAAAAAANGTTIFTPSSSQRVTLSSGVSGWLQDLGLGKYSELFELNEVDTEVLPLLTMDDLREMGVDAVGARRKMFTAIQELGHNRGI